MLVLRRIKYEALQSFLPLGQLRNGAGGGGREEEAKEEEEEEEEEDYTISQACVGNLSLPRGESSASVTHRLQQEMIPRKLTFPQH